MDSDVFDIDVRKQREGKSIRWTTTEIESFDRGISNTERGKCKEPLAWRQKRRSECMNDQHIGKS